MRRYFGVPALVLLTINAATAQLGPPKYTLTFDELYPPYGLYEDDRGDGPLPPNYAGFTWTGFTWFNYLYTTPNWDSAAHSDTKAVAAVVGEISRATPFTFLGGWFGAAYRDGLTLNMIGYRGGTAAYFLSMVMDAAPVSGMYQQQLNWRGVDRIQFIASGGVLNPYVELIGGTYLDAADFTMDDFTFGPTHLTPEPITLVLLGSGLAGIGAMARRRRRTTPN